MNVQHFLSNHLFDKNKHTCVPIHKLRTLNNYWINPSLSLLTQTHLCDKGQHMHASQIRNVYAQNIEYERARIDREDRLHQNRDKVYRTGEFWQTLISQGVDTSTALYSPPLSEHPGFETIMNMMKCVTKLATHNKMKLEPFQLKAIRASICSSGERLLRDDLHRYIPRILKCVGLMHGHSSSDIQNCSEGLFKQMMQTFKDYSKSIVTVVAPRRNGKSKAGKLFVAANVACEKGARVVLMAHRLEAILLYKSEVKSYLEQLQVLGLCNFKIYSSQNEIRVEFPDKSSSFIFFVSGGINVSMMCGFNILCCQFFLCSL